MNIWCQKCRATVMTYGEAKGHVCIPEADMQAALDAGDLPGTPSEAKAIAEAFQCGVRLNGRVLEAAQAVVDAFERIEEPCSYHEQIEALRVALQHRSKP